jgi:hypothetical protein
MAQSVSSSPTSLGSAVQAQQENVDAIPDTSRSHPFWPTNAADEVSDNWNKSFPYQLVWVRRSGNSRIERTFTLPVPPESLTISTPFAIDMSLTQGGVLEQHNGAPVRDIVISGTTGVFPTRGTVGAPTDFASNIPSVFAGTVSAVRQIETAVSQTQNLLGIAQSSPIVNTDSDMQANGLAQGTGFYQYTLLKHFLEGYVEAKRRGDKTLNLGLRIWKEGELYLVTPVRFDVNRRVPNVMEYPFTLQLRAWRRTRWIEATGSGAYNGSVGATDPNKFALIVNSLESARRILEGARAVLGGIRGDIQNILFTPLRQITLFAKDSVGAVLTAVDLPSDIISDLREPILEVANAANGIQQLNRIGTRFETSLNASVNSIQEAFRQLAVSSGKADTQGGRDSTSAASGLFGGTQNNSNASPANKIIENPLKNFAYFSTVRPSDLNLRPATIQKIEAERKKVRDLKRKDFETFRDQFSRVLADFSDFVGAGDSTYTKTYGLPARTTTRTPTDDEWDVIYSLNEVLQGVDSLAASSSVNKDQVTSMDYVAGLASRSGIAFQVPRSKFAVAFPYGSTLEQLSQTYLGTPNRWHEIATLNGLQAPYVDEVGIKISLTANGNGNRVWVADASNLFSGQKVWITSSGVLRESRRVQSVSQVGQQWLVQLDGNLDLSKYTVAAQAYLQCFTPFTINSQQQIYIPSDVESDDTDFLTKQIPGIDYFDPLVRSCGIDFLLTPNNDLVITPDGDGRYAVGLTNQIQKIRLALSTPRGSLMNHPEYGMDIKPGTSTADLSAQQIFSGISQMFAGDPSFTGVKAVSVVKNGNLVSVKLSVGITGTSQLIPVQVEIR